jgi:hypothetical protein
MRPAAWQTVLEQSPGLDQTCAVPGNSYPTDLLSILIGVNDVWHNVAAKKEINFADIEATYVRRTNRWKIYWQRADLKWHAYPPQPEALLFEEFLTLVDEDKDGCFWG